MSIQSCLGALAWLESGHLPSVVSLEAGEPLGLRPSRPALLRRLRREGFKMRGTPPHLSRRIEEEPR